MNHSRLLLLLAFLLPLAAACSEGDSSASSATLSPAIATAVAALPQPPQLPPSDEVAGSTTVFAASSLTETFQDLGRAFSARYPEASVTFNFASSSALATQLGEGANAGVFASADSAQMDAVLATGRAQRSWLFASNELTVVVPKGSSAVRSFEDLAKPGVRLVLAGEQVPAGNYARQAIENASQPGAIAPDFADRALANLRSNETNVRAVLAKVQLGEADAGIVYTTDLKAAGGDVEAVAIPAQYNVIASYPVAILNGAPPAAQAFVLFMFSPEGQAILLDHGFGEPR